MGYEFRGWLNEGENEAFVPESEREKQIDRLREAEDWLDDEGSDAGYREYQTRTYGLKSEYSKYKNRKDAYVEREEMVPTIFNGLDKWRNEIDELTEKKPWITPEEINDVVEKMNEMRTWLEEKVKEQSEKSLEDDPVFNVAQVEAKYRPLDKLYKKIVNKKKPKEKKPPKKEKDEEKKDEEKGEEKSEEKKEDNQEEEKKDEV